LDITDLFVYCLMLAVAPLFIVILAVALLISSPVWVPIEVAHWYGRRHD
jgi:hypothetical protein